MLLNHEARLFSSVATAVIKPIKLPSLVPLEFYLKHKDTVKLVDATWFMKASARENHQQFRLPNARFFDLDQCVSPGGPCQLPHMMPNASQFADYADRVLGICQTDPIVVYDSDFSIFSAARAWYTFRLFGATNIGILEGGRNGYIDSKLPVHGVNDALIVPEPVVFETSAMLNRISTYTDVLQHMENKDAILIDARHADRFAGKVPEPRPLLRRGHIPGAINIHYESLLSPLDPNHPQRRHILAVPDLVHLFSRHGIETPSRRPIVVSCGSGVTACTVIFGLHLIGIDNVSLYDGSWSEWGAVEMNLPIEV